MKSKKALAALSALAQESRLSVFMMLMQNNNGLTAGDIATELQVPLTTMSFHLSQLKTAGLVDSRKEGRFVIYTANRKKAKKLASFIACKEPIIDSKYQL